MPKVTGTPLLSFVGRLEMFADSKLRLVNAWQKPRAIPELKRRNAKAHFERFDFITFSWTAQARPSMTTRLLPPGRWQITQIKSIEIRHFLACVFSTRISQSQITASTSPSLAKGPPLAACFQLSCCAQV